MHHHLTTSPHPHHLITWPALFVPHRFLGKDVTEKLGRVWGLGSGFEGDPGPWEGELRNMWKPTAVEHLWVPSGKGSRCGGARAWAVGRERPGRGKGG